MKQLGVSNGFYNDRNNKFIRNIFGWINLIRKLYTINSQIFKKKKYFTIKCQSDNIPDYVFISNTIKPVYYLIICIIYKREKSYS